MSITTRHYHWLDKALIHLDGALNTVFATQHAERENPAKQISESTLTENERLSSVGMMRVNHTGEVCAQALYRGQLFVARDDKTKDMLDKACAEETDHLAWTHERLQELNGHRSYLNPFWYANSFAIGVVAGLAGDRWSLGFVEETEKQVTKHLEQHLDAISSNDLKSREIIEAMREDEIHHGETARNAGGTDLPVPIRFLMKLHSKVMTTLAYWF